MEEQYFSFVRKWTGLTSFIFILFLSILSSACGGGGGGQGAGSGGDLPPSSPENIQVTPGNTKTTVSWNNVSGAISYNLYWNTTGSTTLYDHQITGVTSPYVHTGLSNSTTYYYSLTAVNSTGESASSSQVSALPQAPTQQNLPSPPIDIQTLPGDGQTSLSWMTFAGDSSYNIYWNTTGNVTTSDNKIAGVVPPYIHANLSNGTGYFYKISTVNSVGESILSKEFYAVPDAYSIYYVSSAAIDNNGDGLSPATAKASIPAAISIAVAPALVLVNAGTYVLYSDFSTYTITLKEGVSLYGNFSADFSGRSTVYKSYVRDQSTVKNLGSVIPDSAFRSGAGISPATVVDGFYIYQESPVAGTWAALLIENGSTPTIQNNLIYGGSPYGVFIDSASPTVLSNNIAGGGDLASNVVYGIYITGSSAPNISYNDIVGGKSVSKSYGIFSGSSEIALIRNNTIGGGNGKLYSYGIQN